MKLISWNVNGFRACLQKGFEDFFKAADADIFCLQETKMQPDQADFKPEGYHIYFHSAVKKGYSGTAVFSKTEPMSVTYGINGTHMDEGRVITCEYDDFYFVCCYVPNAQDGLKRIDYRMEFEDDMRAYLSDLDKKKPVVYCGDLNVAHEEIDLKNPMDDFVREGGFSDLILGCTHYPLVAGHIRKLYPDTVTYSWWSYRFKAREKNAGWRIDYFVVSDRFMERVKDSEILTDIMGSDHCPVMLTTK